MHSDWVLPFGVAVPTLIGGSVGAGRSYELLDVYSIFHPN